MAPGAGQLGRTLVEEVATCTTAGAPARTTHTMATMTARRISAHLLPHGFPPGRAGETVLLSAFCDPIVTQRSHGARPAAGLTGRSRPATPRARHTPTGTFFVIL